MTNESTLSDEIEYFADEEGNLSNPHFSLGNVKEFIERLKKEIEEYGYIDSEDVIHFHNFIDSLAGSKLVEEGA